MNSLQRTYSEFILVYESVQLFKQLRSEGILLSKRKLPCTLQCIITIQSLAAADVQMYNMLPGSMHLMGHALYALFAHKFSYYLFAVCCSKRLLAFYKVVLMCKSEFSLLLLRTNTGIFNDNKALLLSFNITLCATDRH